MFSERGAWLACRGAGASLLAGAEEEGGEAGADEGGEEGEEGLRKPQGLQAEEVAVQAAAVQEAEVEALGAVEEGVYVFYGSIYGEGVARGREATATAIVPGFYSV